MIPDFSTWHAVRSAKPMDLFRIAGEPLNDYNGCMCYVREVRGNEIIVDIPFGNRTDRKTYQIHQLRKMF